MDILLRGVTFSYDLGGERLPVLQDVDLHIPAGEIVAITGEGGSGKSTLAQILAGLLAPTRGQVYWDGKPLWRNGRRTVPFKGRIGLALQQPEDQLFADTVADDVAVGPKALGLPPEEVKRRVERALERVGLPPEMAGRSPFTLSGGQKRRAALAGILALEPEVLILDEPTAGLDPAGRKKILNVIKDFSSSQGRTVVFISHNMAEVVSLARKMLVLHRGRIVLSGSPREIFACGEELVEWGLLPPPLTRVLLELRRKGAQVNTGALTLKEVEEEIWHWLQAPGGEG